MHIDELNHLVIGCAHTVHNTLGCGFLEKVYENAMLLELGAAGIRAEAQARIEVRYRGTMIGEFLADILVEGCLIVELKAVNALAKEHEVQLVNYLAATGMDDGLLINFGRSVEVRRKYRVFRQGTAG